VQLDSGAGPDTPDSGPEHIPHHLCISRNET